MRLIDADLLESNIRELAEDRAQFSALVGVGLLLAADMAADAKMTVDIKKIEQDAYKRGYIAGALQENALGIK